MASVTGGGAGVPGAGIFSVAPASILSGLVMPFSAMRSSTLTPNCAAIFWSESPDWMTYSVGTVVEGEIVLVVDVVVTIGGSVAEVVSELPQAPTTIGTTPNSAASKNIRT